MISFEDFFSEASLRSVFERKIRHRKGVGRDHLLPEKFCKLYPDAFAVISKKCCSDSYVFSPYKESLFLKGRGKLPRVISIPTIRDRIVLTSLTEYLQAVFPECVARKTPNGIMHEIGVSLMNEMTGSFLKADISGFYDNINRDVLYKKLMDRITDPRPLRLIRESLETPTLAEGEKKTTMPDKGVCQGLPISNILAEIYIKECDVLFQTFSSFYCRYVDDILFLDCRSESIQEDIKGELSVLDLSLSEEKTIHGSMRDLDIPFLGYRIKNNAISIKQSALERMIKSLAEMCRRMHELEENVMLRPSFINGEEELYCYYEAIINQKISGIRYEQKLYGWLPFYSEITDLSVLFRLDKILERLVRRYVSGRERMTLHSFVRSFFAIKQNGGGNLLSDFDKLKTTPEKLAFLKSRKRLKDKEYTDEEINILYQQYCYQTVKFELRDIRNVS